MSTKNPLLLKSAKAVEESLKSVRLHRITNPVLDNLQKSFGWDDEQRSKAYAIISEELGSCAEQKELDSAQGWITAIRETLEQP